MCKFRIVAYTASTQVDAGLPESLLKEQYDRCVRIPMKDAARSLNLANSAAIAAYEVLRQWGFPALSAQGRLTGLDTR